MMKFVIEADQDAIRDARSLFEFVGGNSEDAIRIAINRAAPKVRTLASREIRNQVSLKVAYVNERLEVIKASRAKLSGAIRTPSRGLLLSRFSTDPQVASDNIRWLKPPPQPARGISVKVSPSGGTKPVTGDSTTTGKPFYLVLKNSRALGIAARLRGSGKLKVFYGPSLSQVFNTVRDDVLPQASEEYQAQLLDAMRYLLAKKYPPEG